MKQNKKRIEYDDTKTKQLIFYPDSQAEARQLLDKLQKRGFSPQTRMQVPITLNAICQKGLGVFQGKYFCGPDAESKDAPEGNWLCSMEHLDNDHMTAEQQLLTNLFNALHERLDKIEARLDDIQAEMRPGTIDKAALSQKPLSGGRKPS